MNKMYLPEIKLNFDILSISVLLKTIISDTN